MINNLPDNDVLSTAPNQNRNYNNVALPILPISNNNTTSEQNLFDSSTNFNLASGGAHSNLNENVSSNVIINDNIQQMLQKNKEESTNNELFLTDKIREPSSNTLTSPILFNDMIINMKEKPNGPKSINPLFFIINGEKYIDKEKCLNFQMNPHLLRTTKNFTNMTETSKCSDNLMTLIEKENDKIHNQNIFNKQHHDSLKTANFSGVFNKASMDKVKLKTDLKKLIYNNNSNNFENNVRLIKDLTKNEMINRSSGKGIFLFNSNFRNDQHLLRSYKNAIRLQELSKRNSLSINLRKNNFFEPKKYDNTAQVLFARTYMKMTYQDYKIIQEQKHQQKAQSTTYNKKFQKMYEKKEIDIKKYNNDVLNKMRDYKVEKSLKQANIE